MGPSARALTQGRMKSVPSIRDAKSTTWGQRKKRSYLFRVSAGFPRKKSPKQNLLQEHFIGEARVGQKGERGQAGEHCQADSSFAENQMAARPRGPSPGSVQGTRTRPSQSTASAGSRPSHQRLPRKHQLPHNLGVCYPALQGVAGEAGASVSTGCPGHRHDPLGPVVPLGLWWWQWWPGLYDYRDNVSCP